MGEKFSLLFSLRKKPTARLIFTGLGAVLVLVCLVLGVRYLASKKNNSSFSKLNSSQESHSLNTLSPNTGPAIYVEVTGAVAQPGVYKLPVDARVITAIERAGGVIPEVDRAFLIKELNLAKKLSDEEQVYVPFSSEDYQKTHASYGANGDSILVNTFSQGEFIDSGISDTKIITKILTQRPFLSLDEFKQTIKPSATFLKNFSARLTFK